MKTVSCFISIFYLVQSLLQELRITLFGEPVSCDNLSTITLSADHVFTICWCFLSTTQFCSNVWGQDCQSITPSWLKKEANLLCSLPQSGSKIRSLVFNWCSIWVFEVKKGRVKIKLGFKKIDPCKKCEWLYKYNIIYEAIIRKSRWGMLKI